MNAKKADVSAQKPSELSQPSDMSSLLSSLREVITTARQQVMPIWNALRAELSWTHYIEQNLLTRSLHKQCYERNPRFKRFIAKSDLPFKPYADFKKADLEARCQLYQQIAEQIWNPENLLQGDQS